MSRTKEESDAIALLKSDHEMVKKLFEQFEKSESQDEKDGIIQQALEELKIHAQIEEDIFYPALRGEVDEDLMNEADEEHHVARMLIAELDANAGLNEERRNAKFTVLSENVRHHIKEEEGEMMPRAKKADIDFEALGKQLMERKNELKQSGVPEDDEHQLVSGHGMMSEAGDNRSVHGGTKNKAPRKPPLKVKRTA